MFGFSWLELLAIVTLTPVAAFLYIRGHRESRRVAKRDLERLAEIEDIVRLHKVDPRAAEDRARLLEERDDAKLAALRRRAPVDAEAAKELLRHLDRRVNVLRAAERELRKPSDVGELDPASLQAIERELTQLEVEVSDTRRRSA